MKPYNTTLMPPLYNDESYFNYALRSHMIFSLVVIFILLLLLVLLWSAQDWFKIEIKRIKDLPQETTHVTGGWNLRALQSDVKFVDYVVRPGDTLSEIAERHEVGLSVLLRHNRIDNPNTLRAGQRLKIPQRQN